VGGKINGWLSKEGALEGSGVEMDGGSIITSKKERGPRCPGLFRAPGVKKRGRSRGSKWGRTLRQGEKKSHAAPTGQGR